MARHARVAPAGDSLVAGGIATLGGNLNLPVETHEGGSGIPSDFWSQFAQASAGGWDDPSFFPFASFYQPYYQAELYAQTGINVAMGAEEGGASTDPSAITDYMFMMPGTEWWPNTACDNDPKVVGWHSEDEPEMGGGIIQSLSEYRAEIASARSKNDGRFVQTNFGNGVLGTYWPSSGSFEDWVEEPDVVSVDKYAYTSPQVQWIYENQSVGWPDVNYGTGTAHDPATSSAYYWQARQMGSAYQNPARVRPVWVFIEVARPFLYEANALQIVPTHFVGASWGAIIGGARGLAFFDHSNAVDAGDCSGRAIRDCATQRAMVADLIADVSSYATIINQPTLVWDAGEDDINTMSKQYEGDFYMFAQPGYFWSSGSRTFNLPPGVTGSTVTVLNDSNRTINVSDGSFSDTFSYEYEHRIYRVTI